MDEKKATQPITQPTPQSAPIAKEPVKQAEVKAETKAVEKPKKVPKKNKLPGNFTRSEGGINLIPPLTEEEKKTETSKFRLNLSAAYTVLFLVVLSILVLGFNGISKMALNAEKEQLFELEKRSNLRSDLLSYNDEILRRVNLYNNIEESTFSSKEIVEYWQSISQGFAVITNVELTKGLGFTVTGTASSLTNVSRLWFLLANDSHVASVTLKTVVKDGATARFTFEGELNLTEFAQQQ
jgi:hypothetical protein